MPLFSPRRYQKAFLPVKRDPVGVRALTAVELVIKDVLFGCRMCGNCILQETAFICPMSCPKGLRNGLCGESGSERCVVDENRPCTWYLIYDRAERMGRLDKLLEINAPIDGARSGHESWLDLFKFWRERGQGPRLIDWLINRERFDKQSQRILFEYRQPEWWQGDAAYHAPAYEKSVSLLDTNLQAGNFVTTLDVASVAENAPEEIVEKAQVLKKHVVSANYSDNPFGSAHMASIASCKISLETGLEPVLQIQARDRTRAGVQALALGASAMGIRNILCLGGDFHTGGPDPYAIPQQFDIDSVQMLWILRRMRDEGKFIDGREMEKRPVYFLGAAGSPFAAPTRYDAIRIEKKVNAGAQFIQTQMIFDYQRFTDWMEQLDKRGLLDKVAILSSALFLTSAADAHFLASEPGIIIPNEFLKRMDTAAQKDVDGSNEHQIEEGVSIALEIIEKLKATAGIRGIHLMIEGSEYLVPRVTELAGLSGPQITKL
jgi:methylenetetrahydrofolate reductase (NADPH)